MTDFTTLLPVLLILILYVLKRAYNLFLCYHTAKEDALKTLQERVKYLEANTSKDDMVNNLWQELLNMEDLPDIDDQVEEILNGIL
jgi:hypothetical protein